MKTLQVTQAAPGSLPALSVPAENAATSIC